MRAGCRAERPRADVLRVQPHLKKCLEGIKSIDFRDDLVITGMNSAEKEKVPFAITSGDYFVDPKGKNIEEWMVEVEDRMRMSLRFQMLSAVQDYLVAKRTDWMQKWPGQIVLNGSQVHWTSEFETLVK